MYLVILFELNYEVHKCRSANFFFITFDVSRLPLTALLACVTAFQRMIV